MKPFFSDKTPYNCNITLKEKNEIVTDPSKCSEIFNNFFIDTAKCLEIDRQLNVSNFVSDNAVDKAINMFKNHPSIIKVNQAGCVRDKFSFLHVSDDNVFRAINSIYSERQHPTQNFKRK